jgi:5-methylcytosine-specific restriction endonuclease McrA
MRHAKRARKPKEPKPMPEPQEPSQKRKYERYLRSPEWIEKRDRFRAAFGNKCVVCGSTEDLHIHHLNYDCIGNETINDVVCLCKGCHRSAHRKKLIIWVFTKEEMAHFREIANKICSDETLTYLALQKKEE